MIGMVRAEVLRAVSALTFIGHVVLMVFIPFIVMTSSEEIDLREAGAAQATDRVLEPVAWAFVMAAFAGAYIVTREHYYHSLERTVVAGSFRRVFWGKTIAGLLVGVGFGFAISGIWLAVGTVQLAEAGHALTLGGSGWMLLAGALLGSALGGVLGVSIGWLVRNYYVGAALVLLIPLSVEYVMAQSSPEIAKFMPGMTLAALAGPVGRGEMLPFWAALGVALLWVGGAFVAARLLARRRFA